MGQRYRLRFLLQEFDLRGPEVLIGRSPDCHITIEDPLVSRRHARIRIEDGAPPELRDLGSRNGVRLNGTKIDGPQSLSNGDRLRIGTQELVFFVPREQKREARTTGFMATCQSCGTPYPESVERCPHCGATAREDDTMSGVLIEARQAWTFQLLGEVIDRALETDRLDQADRMMRRAAREVDERLTAGDRLQQEQLSIITGYALRLAEQAADAGWLRWSLNVHRQQQVFPGSTFIERLESLNIAALEGAEHIIRDFVAWAKTERETLTPPPPAEAVARMDRIVTASLAP